MVSVEQIRRLALTLPRTTEHLIRDRVRFRVGAIVYAGISQDETLMGFGFPKDQRDSLVAAEPAKFVMPQQSDLRFNWVIVRLDAIDEDEMVELVTDAWTMCVPQYVQRAYFAGEPVPDRYRRRSPTR